MGEAGLYEGLYNDAGQRLPPSRKSKLLLLENGTKRLNRANLKKIGETVKSTVEHLSGSSDHCEGLYEVLLETCGNSIEWGETTNRQWLIGVNYHSEDMVSKLKSPAIFSSTNFQSKVWAITY